MKRFVYIFGISFLLFFASACEVALGPVVNIKGPRLTLVDPSPREGDSDIEVADIFSLTGRTTGESPAVRMEVQLFYGDEVTPKREWLFDKGKGWSYRNDIDEAFVSYTRDVYGAIAEASEGKNPDRPKFAAPYWQTDENDVSWGLPLLLDRLDNGDFYINVKVYDSAKHSDANSSKKIKVVHNSTEPKFSARRFPLLRYSGNDHYPDYPRDDEDRIIFESYIYDPRNAPEETYRFIDRWINKDFEFAWEIDKPIIGDYSLVIEITNRFNFDTDSGKELYYRYEWDGDTLPQKAIFSGTDDPGQIGTTISGYERLGPAIKIDDIKPRDNETGLPKSAGKYEPSEPVYMQIVSTLRDSNGNEERKSNGWFVFWPETRKPWAGFNFGYSKDPSALDDPLLAPETGTPLWINQSKSGNEVYDSSGVVSLKRTIYGIKTDSLDPDGQKWELEPDLVFNTEGTGKNFNWTFNVPDYCAPGRYKMAAEVKNIYGDTAEYTSYFLIESNTTPQLRDNYKFLKTESGEVIAHTSETLFGDSKGNFTIAGTVEIQDYAECDGVHHNFKVDRVSVVWINPNPWKGTTDENGVRYVDRLYEGWNLGEGASGLAHEDAYGNKIWHIIPEFVSGTAGNKNGNEQEDWAFSLPLNVFTDLGVGKDGAGVGQQTFMVRSLSVQGQGVSRNKSSVTQLSNTVGDVNPPVLAIDELLVFEHTGGDTWKEPVSYKNHGGAGFDIIRTIRAGDKIKLRGTWSDDSLNAWTDISASGFGVKDLFGGFSVSWSGDGLNLASMPADFNAAGTWETGEYQFEEDNKDAIVEAGVSLTDLTGRTGRIGQTIVIETVNPTLIRISSETSDGVYGEHKDTDPNLEGTQHYIDIFLEFNKNVMFFTEPGSDVNPGQGYPSGRAPSLNLNNNGGIAYYYYGNGDTRLVFRYYIDGVKALDHLSAVGGHGGGSTTGITADFGKLNVVNIDWGDYEEADLVGVAEGFPVIINNSVYAPGSVLSLAGGKNLSVDKDAPYISGIRTTAGHDRPHGVGSPVYITVSFDDRVVVEGAGTENFYLKLKGGNLDSKEDAKAYFSNVAGASTVSFRYDVKDGHDTSKFSQKYLGVSSVNMGNTVIKDLAGNSLAALPVVPDSGILYNGDGSQLIIDTEKPQPPVVEIQTPHNPGHFYYTSQKKFNITGLESDQVTVDYHLNYDPASPPPDSSWTAVSTVKGQKSIKDIPLDMNGVYNIAVRQSDNATTANRSLPSAPVRVTIDKDPLLQRFGSEETTDGVYGTGKDIKIDMVFRKAVYLPAGRTTGDIYLMLNARGNGVNRNAKLVRPANTSVPVGKSTWTFSYTVQEGDTADPLDVNDIHLGDEGAAPAFVDENGIPVTTSISINSVPQVNGSRRLQKNITVMTGYPAVVDTNMGSGIKFTGDKLEILFNRDIYRGDTDEQLIFTQIKTGYRIPAVLSVSQWESIFIGRTDLASLMPAAWGGSAPAKAARWRQIGEAYYQQGSNGAAPDKDGLLVPDTGVKYVLNYGVDPLDSESGIAGHTVGEITDVLRAAEALRFNVGDREVSIENDTSGRARLLTIALEGEKALPVKGAKYQWSFPNGFVKDFLEQPNGRSKTGSDAILTSGDPEIEANDTNPRTLKLSGVEPPVIRIDKSGEASWTTTDMTDKNRQIKQPLTSMAKIDCRTPEALLEFRKRQTRDSVGRLIARNGHQMPSDNAKNLPYHLPNIANQVERDFDSFNKAKLRPQSGNSKTPWLGVSSDSRIGNTYKNGLNYWIPMNTGSSPETCYQASYAPYNGQFVIGEDDYNAGGMEININARVVGTEEQSYEAAYRSVFVFNNANLNRLSRRFNLEKDVSDGVTETLPIPGLGRMWVRGGDSVNGDSSIPDFPIGRDRGLWKKAKLMTPLSVVDYDIFTGYVSGNAPLDYSPLGTTPIVKEARIPSSYNTNGQYLWVWATWGINIEYTYIDPFYGQLPNSGSYNFQGSTHSDELPLELEYQTPRWYKDLYQCWTPLKEHYPLIRGRTTVIEPRGAYPVLVDGNHGQLGWGPLRKSDARRD